MGAPRLRIDSDDRTLRLDGELELATATALVDEVRMAVRGGAADLCVDLRGLRFVDSAGLAALIRCRRIAQAAGGELALTYEDESPAGRLLALTQLDTVFATV